MFTQILIYLDCVCFIFPTEFFGMFILIEDLVFINTENFKKDLLKELRTDFLEDQNVEHEISPKW